MKRHITSLLASLVLAFSSTATIAAGDHGAGHDHQPVHGGVVAEASDMDFELVASTGHLRLYVRDHGKPAQIAGATAKVTLLNGKDKTEAQLQPAGDRLEAQGDFKAGPGTKAVAAVTLPGKKPVNVRFALK